MRFNLYRFFLIIVDTLNSSVETIDGARFERERSDEKNKRDKKPISADVETSNSTATWCIVEDAREYLKQNGSSPFSLLLSLSITLIVVLVAADSLVYSIASIERDMKTREYLNPYARFFESISLFDCFHRYPNSKAFNRFTALTMIQLLILRIRAIRLRLKTARENKHRYSNINVIQLIVGYFYHFSASTKEWKEFFLKSRDHICSRSCLGLDNNRFRIMRNINNRLRDSERIDRLYRYNQIDFSSCYSSFKILKMTDENSDLEKTSIKSDAASDSNSHVRPYAPAPMHRINPRCLHLATVIYFVAYAGGLLVAVLALISLYTHELTYRGPNYQNLSEIYETAQTESLFSTPTLMRFCLALVIHLLFVIHQFDNGLLVVCAISCASRTQRVILITEQQVLLIDRFSEMSPKGSDQGSLKRMAVSEQELTNFSKLAQIEPNPGLSRGRHVSILNDEYLVYREQIKELNENTQYIVDLICILSAELDDMKHYFTYFLNHSIIYGTLGSVLAYDAMLRSTTVLERFAILTASITTTLPLILAAILGATSEYEVSDADISRL